LLLLREWTFLVRGRGKPCADLEKEYQACRKISVDVDWTDRAPVPGIDTGRALRFPNQGRFHPTKYLAGLARAIVARSGRLYENTAYVAHNGADDRIEIHTEEGRVIQAGSAVFATNSPVNDKVTIHTKQVPDRTYAIAGAVPKGSVPDARTPSSGTRATRIFMFASSRSATART
jgi:glycine/D-amino acid oxidase-like deaminating enzyme